MSRYYDRYDKDGEPLSILPPMPEASATVTLAVPPPDDTAPPFDDADMLYEDLRHRGLSHANARARVAEVFGL